MVKRRRTQPGPVRWGQPSPGDHAYPEDRPPIAVEPPTQTATDSNGHPFGIDGKLVGAAGYVPAGSRRRHKTELRAARQIQHDHRRRQIQTRRAAIDAERQERRAVPYLPAMGEPGPAAGRPWRQLRLTPHRATSEVLAVAYPFLAEEGLGSAGMLIGQDAWSGGAFCYDPWVLYQHGVLTNPNLFLAGQIGRGKSMLAKSLAARCVAFGRRVYVPGDPKGEWTPVARGPRRPGHPARCRPHRSAQPPRRRPPPRRR